MSDQAPGRTLRIALLHGFDPAEVRRGTERLVEELAAGLAAAGHSVTLITAHRGPRREEQRGAIRVIANRRLPAPGPLRRHALSHVPALRRSLRHAEFDVAHAFHPSDALGALGRSGAAPLVFTVPAFPPDGAGAPRRRLLDRVFSGAASVVVPTEAVRVAVAQRHPDARTCVIAPGVDTARFAPGTERAATPTVFCAADPAEPRKRVKVLVDAIGLVREKIPRARLVVADPYRGNQSQPSWLGAPGVELRPIESDDELRSAYGEAWVSALPAHDEPFGLVLTESMACGTPALGEADGGIPEVIGDGEQGRLVTGGAREWARALTAALSAPPTGAQAAAARSRAEEFSMRRCVAGYEALYGRLLGGATG